MTRVLAYTSPARGHLFPIVPVLDALQRRGQEIAVRTLAKEVAMLRARGFEAAPIAAAVERLPLEDYRARSPLQAQASAIGTFRARAAHDAADLREAIEAAQPEAVLVDINCWGARAEAEAWGGPWAMWCPYPLPLPSRDAPPFGPGLPPARGAAGRLRDAVLSRVLSRLVERPLVAQVNAVRASIGLAKVGGVAELFAAPHRLLYMTAEPFEYKHSDWPTNLRLVGPCEWEPPSAAPDWLAEIGRPLVLVSISSEFQDDGRLVRCALEALSGDDVFVVATVPAGDLTQFVVPANAKVVRFAPHAPILARASCAVTHGGMGVTQKALARGVPVCAVPFGRDQLDVARRVEISGAGTRLPAQRLTPERLRSKVRGAMARREGARQIAAAFAKAGGSEAAADAVEELLTE